jgi:hypothetical protein
MEKKENVGQHPWPWSESRREKRGGRYSTHSTLCAKPTPGFLEIRPNLCVNILIFLYNAFIFKQNCIHKHYCHFMILLNIQIFQHKVKKNVDTSAATSATHQWRGILVAPVPFPFRLSVHSRARKSSPPSLYPFSHYYSRFSVIAFSVVGIYSISTTIDYWSIHLTKKINKTRQKVSFSILDSHLYITNNSLVFLIAIFFLK